MFAYHHPLQFSFWRFRRLVRGLAIAVGCTGRGLFIVLCQAFDPTQDYCQSESHEDTPKGKTGNELHLLD